MTLRAGNGKIELTIGALSAEWAEIIGIGILVRRRLPWEKT